jgi:hypothetical protein
MDRGIAAYLMTVAGGGLYAANPGLGIWRG